MTNPPLSAVLVIKHFACQLGVRQRFHFTPDLLFCCNRHAKCSACVCLAVHKERSGNQYAKTKKCKKYKHSVTHFLLYVKGLRQEVNKM